VIAVKAGVDEDGLAPEGFAGVAPEGFVEIDVDVRNEPPTKGGIEAPGANVGRSGADVERMSPIGIEKATAFAGLVVVLIEDLTGDELVEAGT
jgi:hypothetical protein